VAQLGSAGAGWKKELTSGAHASARGGREGAENGRRESKKKTSFAKYAKGTRKVSGWEAKWAGWFGRAGRPRPKEWAGRLGWKWKEKGNPLKMISRFRKMNKEIRVTEIIGKNPKNSQKIVENLGRQERELEWISEHKNLGKIF
jgi:hypothetical protein